VYTSAVVVELPETTAGDWALSSSTVIPGTKEDRYFVIIIILAICLIFCSIVLVVVCVCFNKKKNHNERSRSLIYTGVEMGIFNSIVDDSGV
jgi:hypothetical protein